MTSPKPSARSLIIYCLLLCLFPPPLYGRGIGSPPPEAFSACSGQHREAPCNIKTPHGLISGSCMALNGQLACIPEKNREKEAKSINRQRSNSSTKMLMDVHGAGAQRSDPKSGNPDNFPEGHGPQGDVISIYNAVRCVRGNTDPLLAFAVVDTGQSKCYDDGSKGVIPCPRTGEPFAGQDAQYTGLAASYTDNHDGTVTDRVTGLMWQKSFSKSTFNNAAEAAVSCRTGDYRDWRVPTIKELYSLMNFNGATGSGNFQSSSVPSDAVPYLDRTFFAFEYPTDTGRFIDAQYLTNTAYSSTVMDGQKAFFGVNFADGRIKGYPQAGSPKRSEFYLRLVRGNAMYGQNTFMATQQTVTDRATGLQWMRIDSAHANFTKQGLSNNGFLNWQEALQFCEDLDFAGKSDWRLPNAKELHTIVDYSRSPGTTQSAAIDPVFMTTAINNPAGNKDYPYFWTSTTHLDGRKVGERAVYIAFGQANGYMAQMGRDRGNGSARKLGRQPVKR